MSKRVRAIIAALVCLALLVGAALVLTFLPTEDNKKPTGQNTSATSGTESQDSLYGNVKVYEFKTENVRDVVVENVVGGYTLSYVKEKTWTVKGTDSGFLTDKDLKDTLLSCTEFIATKLISEKPTNMEAYGLDKPKATATISYSTGEKMTVLVGNDNPSGGTYIYVKENDKIYLSESSFAEVFLQKNTAFLDMSVVNAIETDEDGNEIDPKITKITYTGPALKSPIVIEQNPEYVTQLKELEEKGDGAEEEGVTVNASQFIFTSPMVADVSNDAFEGMQYQYYGLVATDIYATKPTSKQISDCGLKNPQVVISLYDKNGTTKINLGNKLKIDDTEYYYVMSSGKKPIFIVEASNFTFFEEDLINYMSAIVVNVMIDDIKTLTVEMDGKKYVFEESGTGEELVVRYNGKKLSTAEYRDLYQLVMLVYCEESVEPGQYKGDASLKLTYTYRDREKVDVVEYVKVATRKYMIRRNGSDLALVRSKYVDTLVYGVNELVAGRDVPSDY